MKSIWIFPLFYLSLLMTPLFALDLGIDEMGGEQVDCSGTNGPKTLFTLSKFPIKELYLFDFNSERFIQVKDGRLKLSNMNICPWKKGFVLFVRPTFSEGVVYFLDDTGAFVDSMKLADMVGMADGLNFLHFSRRPDGKYLVSYEDGRDWKTAHLGLLDLEKKQMIELTKLTNSDKDLSSLWVSATSKTYLFNPYSGKIQKTSSKYQPVSILRHSEALAESGGGGKAPSQFKEALFLRYNPNVSLIFEHADGIAFTHNRHTNEKVQTVMMGQSFTTLKTHFTHYLISDDNIIETPDAIIGRYQFKTLSFEKEGGTFQLNK